MNGSQLSDAEGDRELVYFWVLGDMHYRAHPAWQRVHAERFELMFADLHELWREEGRPEFCVSPGDLVETGALENHQLARAELESQLEGMPFYPGIGNHEFFRYERDPMFPMMENYRAVWERSPCYSWSAGGVTGIMLDYPDPTTLADWRYISISQETLDFLEHTLAEYTDKPALIFLHCPLRGTVLDRDPERHLDYHSLQHFFSPENSQDVRAILARHPHASLLFSGHTHSGWEAPQLVYTEDLGAHPVTFINSMSPWYTGVHHGARLDDAGEVVEYAADTPDIVPTLAVRVYRDHALIRVRDHKAKRWLKSWNVPM